MIFQLLTVIEDKFHAETQRSATTLTNAARIGLAGLLIWVWAGPGKAETPWFLISNSDVPGLILAL